MNEEEYTKTQAQNFAIAESLRADLVEFQYKRRLRIHQEKNARDRDLRARIRGYIETLNIGIKQLTEILDSIE
jgi:hypothetical protein